MSFTVDIDVHKRIRQWLLNGMNGHNLRQRLQERIATMSFLPGGQPQGPLPT